MSSDLIPRTGTGQRIYPARSRSTFDLLDEVNRAWQVPSEVRRTVLQDRSRSRLPRLAWTRRPVLPVDRYCKYSIRITTSMLNKRRIVPSWYPRHRTRPSPRSGGGPWRVLRSSPSAGTCRLQKGARSTQIQPPKRTLGGKLTGTRRGTTRRSRLWLYSIWIPPARSSPTRRVVASHLQGLFTW